MADDQYVSDDDLAKAVERVWGDTELLGLGARHIERDAEIVNRPRASQGFSSSSTGGV